MRHVDAEIASQPECWRQAIRVATGLAGRPGESTGPVLPAPGERVAVLGCGTSWFVAMAYAAAREQAGHGETDAYPASELPARRRYDRYLAITRSGTTTEVLDRLRASRTTSTVITGDPGSPVTGLATHTVSLPFADERSVVQTRFATSALALLRTQLGEDLAGALADAAAAVTAPLPVDPAATGQVTFLGRGWTVGLAHEAALKCREAAGFWAESYPAMEYRHGPIAIAGPGRVVWALGDVPAGLAAQVKATGARFVAGTGDPMAGLVLAQRFAVALAARRGLDPDHPRHLTRSVVLPSPSGAGQRRLGRGVTSGAP